MVIMVKSKHGKGITNLQDIEYFKIFSIWVIRGCRNIVLICFRLKKYVDETQVQVFKLKFALEVSIFLCSTTSALRHQDPLVGFGSYLIQG